MSEFWLWFWKPIAETLGVLTLIVLIAVGVGVCLWLWDLWINFRRWWQRKGPG